VLGEEVDLLLQGQFLQDFIVAVALEEGEDEPSSGGVYSEVSKSGRSISCIRASDSRWLFSFRFFWILCTSVSRRLCAPLIILHPSHHSHYITSILPLH
jgi:hypothetical protein